MLALISTHLLFAAFTPMLTLIPLFAIDRGAESWQLGLVVGSFGIAGIASRPIAGRWTAKHGARQVAVAGALLFAAATVLHLLASDGWWIIPARVLQGVGLAAGPIGTSTIIANLAPGNRRGEAMSWMGNAIASASVYAPFLGFMIFENFGFGPAFTMSAVFALIGGVSALLLSNRGSVRSDTIRNAMFSRAALVPTLIFCAFTFTTAPPIAFLPQLALHRDLGNPGLYFTAYATAGMLVMLFSGRAADKLGRNAIILPGLIASAAAMFLVTQANGQAVFLLAATVHGVGLGLVQPGVHAMLVDRLPPSERAGGMATLNQAWDIGGFGGAIVLGPVASAGGMSSPFMIAGAVALGGAGTIGYGFRTVSRR